MSAKQLTRLSPFLGVMTSVDKRDVPPPYATDSLNTMYEDGRLRPRRGFRNIVGEQRFQTSAMDALKLFDRASGVVSNAEYSRYVTVERYSTSTSNLGRLMTVNTTTGAREKVLRDVGVNQVNDFTLGGAGGGDFTITVNGATTAPILAAATNADILAALNLLSTVDAGDVVVSTPVGTTRRLTWNWAATTANSGTVVTVTMNSAGLTGTTTTPVMVVSRRAQVASEVTKITMGGPTNGTFTLTFYSATTGDIAFNASASAIQTALEALSNVNPGDVTVTAFEGDFYVFWGGRYLGDNLTAPTVTDSTSGGTGVVISTVFSGTEGTYASDGTSAVPVLADSYWKILVFNGTVYGFNYAAGSESPQTSEDTPLWRFTLGDAYSFETLKPPAAPDDADNKISIEFRKQAGSSVLDYDTFDWQTMVNNATDRSLDATVITAASATGVNCVATVSAVGNGYLENILATATGDNANQNFQYGDAFCFIVTRSSLGVKFDTNAFKVYLKDTNGVQVEMQTRVLNPGDDQLEFAVFCEFPVLKTRADWAATKHMRFEFNVTAISGGVDTFTIGPVKIGGMPRLFAEGKDAQVGYAYHVDSTDLSSAIGGIVQVPWEDLAGNLAFPYGNVDGLGRRPWLGVVPYLTLEGSSNTTVDKLKICMRQELLGGDRDPEKRWSQWRELDEVAESATVNYVLQTVNALFQQKPAFTGGDFQFDDIVNAAVIHGYVQWTFRKNNRFSVRDSMVGDPLNLVKTDNSDLDILDPLEGANWVLSDVFDDEPVVSLPVPGGNFVLGTMGVYAQNGMVPLQKTPLARLPGAKGCFGPDAAKMWRTESGDPAVVYVDRTADSVFFIPAFAVADRDKQFNPDELSVSIRGKVKDFLLQGSQNVTRDRMELVVDYIGDALWIVYVDRAVVLRRKSLRDNRRQWEFYRYNLNAIGSSWLKCHFSEDLGMRCMRINGAMDEVEYDTTDGFTPINPLWYTPSSNNTTTFTYDGSAGHTDPVWATGYQVVLRVTVGNLTAGTVYYVRSLGGGSYSLYDTYAHAVDTASVVGRISLTGPLGTVTLGEVSAGRDDGFRVLNQTESVGGTSVDFSMFWKSGMLDDGGCWSLVKTELERDNYDDTPTIAVYGDRMDKAGTRTDGGGSLDDPVERQLEVGKIGSFWPKWLRGKSMQFEVQLSENCDPVTQLDAHRVPAVRRHRA